MYFAVDQNFILYVSWIVLRYSNQTKIYRLVIIETFCQLENEYLQKLYFIIQKSLQYVMLCFYYSLNMRKNEFSFVIVILFYIIVSQFFKCSKFLVLNHSTTLDIFADCCLLMALICFHLFFARAFLLDSIMLIMEDELDIMTENG